MMATTFGHNFNFAAAKQNGEAFQQFPSHGLSLCLPLSLTLSLSVRGPEVKIFIFSNCQQMFSIHFLRHLQRTLPGPAFLCECTRRTATKLDEMSSFPLGVLRGAGTRGKRKVGVPWAKRAQASTTTRMTSRSSRRLSATATATSDARKGLTKRKAMEMLLLLQFSAKNFWCKSSENERSGRNATKYIYVYRCGWVYFLGSIRDPGPLNAAHGS